MTPCFSSFFNPILLSFKIPMTLPGSLKRKSLKPDGDLSFARVSAGPAWGLNGGEAISHLIRACCLGPHPLSGADLYPITMQNANFKMQSAKLKTLSYSFCIFHFAFYIILTLPASLYQRCPS